MTKKYTSITEYINDFPKQVADELEKIRQCVIKEAPNSEELISYNMPAFKQKKILVYFAAFKNHIGFYALPSGNEEFKTELSKYKTGKGSIQFPLDKPIPYDLIRRIIRFRLEEISK